MLLKPHLTFNPYNYFHSTDRLGEAVPSGSSISQQARKYAIEAVARPELMEALWEWRIGTPKSAPYAFKLFNKGRNFLGYALLLSQVLRIEWTPLRQDRIQFSTILARKFTPQ